MNIINHLELEKITGNDPELLADVAIIFVRSLPEIKARIEFGIENRENEDIVEAAHQLRGRVSYFGADSLKTIASQLESAARAKKVAKIPEIKSQLFDGIDQLLNELRELTSLSLEVNED